jgi:hypothetical protein
MYVRLCSNGMKAGDRLRTLEEVLAQRAAALKELAGLARPMAYLVPVRTGEPDGSAG